MQMMTGGTHWPAARRWGFALGREHNLRDILVGEVVWLGRYVDGGKVRRRLMG